MDGRRSSPIQIFTLDRVVVGLGIVLTVIRGSVNGSTDAREIRQNRIYLGEVTVRANQYRDTAVATSIVWKQPSSFAVRSRQPENDSLSLFGTGDATSYLSEKPFDFYGSP